MRWGPNEAGVHSTTEVELPANCRPLFPECCVECCGPAQTARRHRIVRTGSALQLVLPLPALPGPAWWVPYCRRCETRTRRRLLLLRAIGYPILLGAMLVSFVLARATMGHTALTYFVALALAIALAFPLFLWGIAWRPPFDAEIERRTLRCRFRSREYARAFRELNTRADDPPAEPLSQGQQPLAAPAGALK